MNLSPVECLALMRTTDLGRVALVGEDGDVEIFPVNYTIDDDTILFRTATGTKQSLIDAGHRVTFQADERNPFLGDAWSVVVKGTAREVRHDGGIFDPFVADVHSQHPGEKPILVRLVPDTVTGRRFELARTSDVHGRDKPAVEPGRSPSPRRIDAFRRRRAARRSGSTTPAHPGPYQEIDPR